MNDFLIRVPGKVILFGEHAVVYPGKSALACSLGIYTYALLQSESSQDGSRERIGLKFPNVELFESWNLNELLKLNSSCFEKVDPKMQGMSNTLQGTSLSKLNGNNTTQLTAQSLILPCLKS